MRALAGLLNGMGWRVTGSDMEMPAAARDAMTRRGLRVHAGHAEKYLPENCDVLVHTSAVGPMNPERQQAERLGIPQISFSRMLGRLMQDRVGVCIAGTHGKSTTTAITAWILRESGFSPSAVIGATLCGEDQNGWAGDGELLVAESCEYQRNFLNLSPQHAVILGIEADHFDSFADIDEIESAFAEFADRVSPSGTLLLNGDCPRCVSIADRTASTAEMFSLQKTSDWWAADWRSLRRGSRFRVFARNRFVTEISLPIPGRHNVQNALAAVALCVRLGVPVQEIRESIAEFPGIQRRYERVGFWRGVTIIDDYAHHPTAVRATLETVRQEYPERRVWCLFQPHQVLRTRRLMSEFAGAFTAADEILLTKVYRVRESVDADAKSASIELTAGIVAHGGHCRYVDSLDRMVRISEDESRPGDVVVIMGAGDIDRIRHEFTRSIQRDHPPE